jgi:type IV pilus assembly protein PilA
MNWAKIIALLASISMTAWAQAPSQPPPQTARQALLEMFFGKSPKALEKHLAPATLAALRKADSESFKMNLAKLASLSAELNRHGSKLQTFEAGPVLITLEEPAEQKRTEIVVERDDLSGDEDEIELSVRMYKDEQPDPLPILPRLTFLMKEQDHVWRLTEFTIAGRVPLADPEYLKGLVKQIEEDRSRSDRFSAVANLRTLLTAEAAYQTSFPQHGFACSLSELGGAGSGKPDEHHAMLIDDTLASGKKSGYTYAISDCTHSSFHLTATSADIGEARAFCADESGVIKFAADGSATTCISAGEPLR